jgi:hypothetical protein
MSFLLPDYNEPFLEMVNGRPTGRINWRWYAYFEAKDKADLLKLIQNGVDFGPGAPANMTVVNGQITEIT